MCPYQGEQGDGVPWDPYAWRPERGQGQDDIWKSGDDLWVAQRVRDLILKITFIWMKNWVGYFT